MHEASNGRRGHEAPNEKLLIDTIKVTLATYVQTRRRTQDDIDKATAELKIYVPQLIRERINDRTQLVVKCLVRLRELEDRPLPQLRHVWTRRRAEIANLSRSLDAATSKAI